jgi:hypothetical protein
MKWIGVTEEISSENPTLPFPSVNVTRWNRALANPIFHGVKSVMFVAGDETIEGGSQSPCATSKPAVRGPPMHTRPLRIRLVTGNTC